MRGHIVKRGTDSYSIVLNLGTDPATGKRKQQWISIKGNKKEAEKKLSEMLHQLDTGNFVAPGKITVADYLESWLKDYCLPNLSPRTSEGYEFIVRKHLIPALGKRTLTQLKPEHIQRLYSEKLSSGRRDGKGGLSKRSVQYIHVTLHKALKTAVRLGIIGRNPTDAVEHPKLDHREMHAMNESDIHLFLEFAKSTQYYPMFYVALFTGLRRSEFLALKWADIDLSQCQLSVKRTIHQLHAGEIIFRPPKTEKSRRLVSLSESTVELLTQHKTKQAKHRLPITDDDLVFCQIDGKPFLPDSITHAWIHLARKVGLPDIRLHDARHTHASIMLKQGEHPKIVQERLGHSSIQITLDTYSHVAPGLQKAAANRFDTAILHTLPIAPIPIR